MVITGISVGVRLRARESGQATTVWIQTQKGGRVIIVFILIPFWIKYLYRFTNCAIVNTRTAILVYKQAILLLLEYAGFVLGSCSIGQRRELQKLQNNALRLCKKYYLLDMTRIDVLHNECRILGLEQRHRKQLLRLMYLHSRNDNDLKVPVRLTRAGTKLIFKTATKCTTKYLNSPFYKGTLLWNQLSSMDQRANTVSCFVNCVARLYVSYQEIW